MVRTCQLAEAKREIIKLRGLIRIWQERANSIWNQRNSYEAMLFVKQIRTAEIPGVNNEQDNSGDTGS